MRANIAERVADRFPKKSLDQLTERQIGWLFVLPALVSIVLITAYPFVRMLFTSLFTINSRGEREEFIALENYVTVLTDGRFLESLEFTFLFVVIVVVIQFLLGLGVALLLFSDQIYGGQRILVLSLPPMFVAPIVSGLLWRMLLDVQFGPVNYVFGLSINWLGTQPWAFVAIILADVWQWTPIFVLVFGATLQSIPEKYYEAARMDGMSNWQQFKWITIPQLRSAVVIIVILRIIKAMKVFPKLVVMTGGGPGTSTESLAMIVYQYGFQFFDMGKATAAGTMYWIIMFAISILIFQGFARSIILSEN